MAAKTLNKAVDAGYGNWRTVSRYPVFVDLHDMPQFVDTKNRMRDVVSVERSNTE